MWTRWCSGKKQLAQQGKGQSHGWHDRSCHVDPFCLRCVSTTAFTARAHWAPLPSTPQPTPVCRFPTLKVAYLDDAVDPERQVPTQYSVLNRNRRAADPIVDPTQPFNKIVEAYRIRLPINRSAPRPTSGCMAAVCPASSRDGSPTHLRQPECTLCLGVTHILCVNLPLVLS